MNAPATPLTARRNGQLTGHARVPGDKSISIRALILGSLAVGETRIGGLLEGEDVLNTAQALRALGASLERRGGGAWRVHGVGVGGFASPGAETRFRQFGHRLPADAGGGRGMPDRRASSMATLRCASGRCAASSIHWSGSARAPSCRPTGGCR